MSSFLSLDLAASLLTGVTLGAMAFFAAVMAPLVFIKLPAEVAGGFIRQVFPVYYRMLAATALLAAACAWGRWDAVILLIVGFLFVFALVWLMPRINLARDASVAGDAVAAGRFERLHRTSVVVNGVQMMALLVVFLRLAA